MGTNGRAGVLGSIGLAALLFGCARGRASEAWESRRSVQPPPVPRSQPSPASDGGAPGDAAPPGTSARYAAFAAAFDAERASFHAPGAAVAIMERGRLAYAAGFGTKGPNTSLPVDARTLFRIGSMTKSLTATGYLHQVSTGKATLGATLTSIVPDVGLDDPANVPRLTMFELLTHSSGLADLGTYVQTSDDAELSQYLTSAQFGSDVYFNDPPGTLYDYANVNFALVGLAIERLTGAYYRQAMYDTVFAPLSMDRTFFLPSEVVADGDYAEGFATASWSQPDGGTTIEQPGSDDCAWMRPAGWAFTSVLDYEKFMEFLVAGNPAVMGDSERAAMQAFQVTDYEEGNLEGYGFGVMHDRGLFIGNTFYDLPLVQHDGAIDGFSAEFYLLPSIGFGIVAFASTDNAYFDSSVALAMQSFASLPAPTTGPNETVDPATYPAMAGSYYDPHVFGAITVTDVGGSLRISIPSADASGLTYDTTLAPVAPGLFTLNMQTLLDPEIAFIPGGGGYAWLRNREFVAQRN